MARTGGAERNSRRPDTLPSMTMSIGQSCGAELSQSLGFRYDAYVPTVLKFDGLRVAIYPNDHRPAHVHVIGAGCEAVFVLDCPSGPVELRENYGFSVPVLRTIAAALNARVRMLCREWESIHGID